MKMPEYVKNCIELLEQSGFSGYAVGGAVRDSMLGIVPSDWDVTTSATPNQTLEVFANFRTIPTGIKHGTVTVMFNHEGDLAPIEITTYRIDGEYHDSRHPESVSFSNDVRDDLLRRDFTVNAMAYNEKNGLVDVFGGKKDLENCIIRAVGNPEKRFTEDALRILRAFRFSAQLGFEIEENTLLGATKCAHLLKNIARERVGTEFKKLISSKYCSKSLAKMVDLGVCYELFDAKMPERETIDGLSNVDGFEARMGILTSTFSEDEKLDFLSSLRLSNAEKKRILKLSSVREYVLSNNFCVNEICARKFLHTYNHVSSDAIVLLRFYGELEFAQLVTVQAKKEPPLSISSLDIRGDDLLPLCSDYSKIGKMLNYLLERVIECPELNKKEKLIEIAKQELK